MNSSIRLVPHHAVAGPYQAGEIELQSGLNSFAGNVIAARLHMLRRSSGPEHLHRLASDIYLEKQGLTLQNLHAIRSC
jgi:hypothetical protein